MTASIEEILGQIKLPEKSVPLCLAADMQATFEELERALKEARDRPRTLAGNSEAVELAEQIQELRAEMQAHTATFLLRALPRRVWSDLLKKHPAESGEDGEYNPETFPTAALAACCVSPAMTEDQAGRLVDQLTQGQWNKLWLAVVELNVGAAEVPTSVSASAILQGTRRS